VIEDRVELPCISARHAGFPGASILLAVDLIRERYNCMDSGPNKNIPVKEGFMRIPILGLAALFALSLAMASAQSAPPKDAIDISAAQIQAVLKAAPLAQDHTLRVIDMGGYQLSVAVIHRGPTGRSAGSGKAPAESEGASNVKCGLAAAPAGAKTSDASMIEHDDTVETYVVISGGGTLVTGGQIVNGRRSGPDSEITKILNGPSCSGRAVGNIVTRKLSVGDISVIPAGVPHGWTDITTEVTYLSIRPDPKKVLQHNYVNPHLADVK
jgi:mannose-6-phosphate isomerase-like protein (cupin superfamily)